MFGETTRGLHTLLQGSRLIYLKLYTDFVSTVEPHYNEHPRDQGLLFAGVGSVRSPGFPLELAIRGWGGHHYVPKTTEDDSFDVVSWVYVSHVSKVVALTLSHNKQKHQ